MASEKRNRPTLAHRAEYYTMRATLAGLRALTWDQACKVGEQLGALGYRPLGIRKTVVERQIAAAFPELGPSAVVRLARDSYKHLGRTFVETALLDSLGRDGLQQLVESVDGWEHIDDVMQKGRGAVMVTGHIGNWELAGAYVAARGVPLDAIARGMANPLFDAYINKTREAIGLTIVHDSEAVRRRRHSCMLHRAARALGSRRARAVLLAASKMEASAARNAGGAQGSIEITGECDAGFQAATKIFRR
jgi:KDO2-lipid IV(A) lauroyltransferase